jgi:cytochrome c peroxidase
MSYRSNPEQRTSIERGNLGWFAIVLCFLSGFPIAGMVTSAHADGLVPGAILRLEIEPNLEIKGARGIEVTRLDFLLSALALQRIDGSWVESRDWYAYLSAKENDRQRAEADGVPGGEFKAIRFAVGLDDRTNHAEPSSAPVGHALHPEVNHLHWGWQGGYIFMALEGHWKNEKGSLDGFSFHLANAPQRTMVELPVTFRGGGPLTLRFSVDASKLLSGVDFDIDGTSTHSREGDPLAAKIAKNIPSAFSVRDLNYDHFQTFPLAEKSAAIPAGTKPFTLQITERFPKVPLPADNPLTEEGVALGKQLFNDKHLSFNNTQSCASCHDTAHALSDPRQFSVGSNGDLGKRNAMALFNLAWHGQMFWDGRARNLRDQVLMPVQDVHEMNEKPVRVVGKLAVDPQMTAAFDKSFGPGGITVERVSKALEQHLLTLISQDSKFDRAVRKVETLTDDEKRGLQLFVTEFDPKRGLRGADCFHCHGGTLFSDHQFHNNGLALAAEDIGREAVTHDPADKGKFKAPSLRNIALTAPYMHDGRFQTLEEVVEHYSTGVQRSLNLDPNLAKHPVNGLQLTAEEKRSLVAFLKTLTDKTFAPTATENRVANSSPTR